MPALRKTELAAAPSSIGSRIAIGAWKTATTVTIGLALFADQFGRAAAQRPMPSGAALPPSQPPTPAPPPPSQFNGRNLVPVGPNGAPIAIAQTFYPAIGVIDYANIDSHDTIPLSVSGPLNNDGRGTYPCIVCTDEAAPNSIPSDVSSYETEPAIPVSGTFTYQAQDQVSTLYSGGFYGLPQSSDVHTGFFVGDVGLGATMAAFADADPNGLQGLFTGNGHQGSISYLTVNLCETWGGSAPAQIDSSLAYDDAGRPLLNIPAKDPSTGAQILWPSLIEKAIAVKRGGYDAIVGNVAAPYLAMLTCSTPTYLDPHSYAAATDLENAIGTMFSGVRKIGVLSIIDVSDLDSRGGIAVGNQVTFGDNSVLSTISDGGNTVFKYLSALGSEYTLIPGSAYAFRSAGYRNLNGVTQPAWELTNPWGYNLNPDGIDSDLLPAALYVPTDLLFAAGDQIIAAQTN